MVLKVGMRVRVIANHCPRDDEFFEWGEKVVGHEGVIVGTDWHPEYGEHWIVRVPAVRYRMADCSAPDEWGCLSSELAPLTDPSADEWADAQIAKLKKLGSEPVPLTPKQLDEVRSA